MLAEEITTQEGGKAAQERTLVTRLEREVNRLKSKCGRLEGKQKWLNLVTLILMLLALVLILWPLTSVQLFELPNISAFLAPYCPGKTTGKNEL